MLEQFVGHAVCFKTCDHTKSERLAKREHCEKKRCFDNCQRIAIRYATYKYYEGYVCIEVMNTRRVCKHAWLVNRSGYVLDPTASIQPLLREAQFNYMGIHIPGIYLFFDCCFPSKRWKSALDRYIVEMYL